MQNLWRKPTAHQADAQRSRISNAVDSEMGHVRPQPAESKPGRVAVVYRSLNRPPVPKLTVLDDGEQRCGEVHRLRGLRMTIGRVGCDVPIPHDPDLSAFHASICRQERQGGYEWRLVDAGSTNGTFVRLRRVVLRHGMQLYLGGRRFVFICPESVPQPATDDAEFIRNTQQQTQHSAAASRVLTARLMEQTRRNTGGCYLLTGSHVRLGQDATRCGVSWSDPFLDDVHADLKRDGRGRWWISDHRSVNGIWVRVTSKVLDTGSEFRLGGQRFLFERPSRGQLPA